MEGSSTANLGHSRQRIRLCSSQGAQTPWDLGHNGAPPIITGASVVLNWRIGSAVIPREARAMGNLYRTSNEAKTLEIEDTEREGHPFRMVVTLKKLNMVTMLDYFLTEEESQEIADTLTSAKNRVG